jgi:signal transduction histidine kinase
MKHTILCVDDELNNVEALERLLRKKYTILKAESADEGLALVKKNHVSLIISDQRMPHKTGVEFLKESREFAPNAIRILLTGYTDIESAIEAINSGEVYRYIAKPWDPADLANTVDKAIERFELGQELKQKNKELEKALNELKVLDEAKDKFMILINHELKTPLTVIMSYSELLKESKLTPEQNKFLGRIIDSSDRLKKMVDDTMLFINAESGKLITDNKKTTTNEIFKALESELKTSHSDAIKLLDFENENLTLKTDAHIIKQILLRLIENAIKHGKAGARIRIDATKKGGGVRFAVQNEGKAISKKIIDSLHRPFNLDKDIMKHSEGLGLGLSLSQALLKRMGTSLEFDYDDGTVTAHFTLK